MATQQKMVRTFDGQAPSCTESLEQHLVDGWTVLFITPCNGHTEYILQKVEPVKEVFTFDDLERKAIPVKKR